MIFKRILCNQIKGSILNLRPSQHKEGHSSETKVICLIAVILIDLRIILRV